MSIDHHIKGIIWDLDNTLYRFTSEFRFSCNQAAAKAVIELGFEKSYDECLDIALKSSKAHHFSLYTFIHDYGLDYGRLHVLFHQNMRTDLIEPIEGAVDKMRGLTVPQIILTNGSRDWAKRALHYIRADDLFSDNQILAMEDADMTPKAQGLVGYKKALDYLDMQPNDVIFIDDLDRNLKKAKEVGLKTAYVHHGAALQSLPRYMDYQFQNPIDFIEYFGW